MSKSRYVKLPQPGEETRPLYEATLRVLSGQTSVTEAAASVSLSRVRFQTRLNRGLTGFLAALEAKPRGRKPMPEPERLLREEVVRLEKEVTQLKARLAASARMMGVASEWMHKGLQSARSRKTSTSPEATVADADEDGPARALEVVSALRAEGVVMPLAASAAGVSAPTVRRWRQRRRAGELMRCKRGPRRARHEPPAASVAEVNRLLTQTSACIGAAPLARAVGISRRVASALKGAHLTRVERERREASVRVELQPGVVRGFDAMFVSGQTVLVSADGGVPFRTSIDCVSRYDEANVAAAIERDFERHGAPLVLRCDRWKAHDAPRVAAVLEAAAVLVMHGPPHCPRFYGQLERQNREHRAWLEARELDAGGQMQAMCDEMRETFNDRVPRRTLRWRTAGEAWRGRGEVVVDRRALAEEVEELTQQMKEQACRVAYPGLYERLAIQRALINRGLLRLTKGGWC